MKECMKRLEQTVSEQGSQLRASNDQCKTGFAAIRAETQSQFGVMANMFQDSLQKALAGHDTEVSNQFAEQGNASQKEQYFTSHEKGQAKCS